MFGRVRLNPAHSCCNGRNTDENRQVYNHVFVSLCRVMEDMFALMLIKSTENLFKCTAAMSPVTDWSLYGKLLM